MVDIETKVDTKVTVNGHDINKIVEMTCNLAHEVLEELSIYRQEHDLDDFTFMCEGSCCEFLNTIGD